MKNSKDINKISAQNQNPDQGQELKETKKPTTFMPSMAHDELTFDTAKEAKKKGGLDAIVRNPVVIIIIAVILSILVGKMVFAAPTMSQYTADINRHDTELLALHKQVDPMVTKVDGFNSKITSANETANQAKAVTDGIQNLITTSVNNGVNNILTDKLSQYIKTNDVNNTIDNKLSEYIKASTATASINSSVNNAIVSSSVISGQTAEIQSLKTQVTSLNDKVTKLETTINSGNNNNTDNGNVIDDETGGEYTVGNSQPLGMTINGNSSLSYTFKDISYNEDTEGNYVGEELSKRMSVRVVNNATFGKGYTADVLLYVDFNKDIDYFISDEDNFVLEDEDGEWDNYGLDSDDIMVFRKEVSEYFDPGEKMTFSNVKLSFTPDVWSPSSENTEWDLKMVIRGLIDY